MRITGTHSIAAPRTLVWSALNDPAVLRRSLPGCESVVSQRPGEFDVVVAVQVGPLKARFGGTLEMSDVHAPEGCVLHFRGQGGAMGFAKGTSTVELREDGPHTVISYSAQAQIGGRLAQLGSRMVDAVARRTSEQFFSAFQQAILAPAESVPPDSIPSAAQPPASAAPAPSPASGPYLVPAWWLLLATALGAAAALGGMLLAN